MSVDTCVPVSRPFCAIETRQAKAKVRLIQYRDGMRHPFACCRYRRQTVSLSSLSGPVREEVSFAERSRARKRPLSDSYCIFIGTVAL